MDAITIYSSAFEICGAYDADTRARLVGYMAWYALTGEEPTFAADDPARYVWPALKEKADRTREAYEQRKNAGRSSAEKRRQASEAQAETQQEVNDISTETQRDSNEKSTTPQRDVNETSTEGQPETETETEYETDTDKDTRRARAREAKEAEVKRLERFGRFWAAYPRKVAKAEALKKFEKLDPDDALLDTILQAVAAWSKSDQWTRDDGQYIPHPATWIHQRRWEDEIPKPGGGPKKTVPAQQYEQRDYSGENDDEEMARMIFKNVESARNSGIDVDEYVRKYPNIAARYGVVIAG